MRDTDDLAGRPPGARASYTAALAGVGGVSGVALAVAIFAVLLGLASRTTLWDRDEPRFAQATVEMIAAGDYLVPTFNGKLRADKPVLVYWLMSLPVRWLGPTAVAARFWSVAAMALAALLTFAAARCLLPAPAGLWAVAVLAATPLAVIEGQAATADALLLAALTAALACFAAALAGDGRSRWPWLGLGMAVGLAQLAKGPVGLAVPALAIATTLALLRRRRRGAAGDPQADPAAAADDPPPAFAAECAGGGPASVGRLGAWAALACLLGTAIFLAWAVPANLATGGELARLGIGKHVVGRALGAMEGHGGTVWNGGRGWLRWLAGLPFYLPVLWLGFAPWVLWLPAAVSAVLGGRIGGERGRALLIGWTVPTFALMTLVATRLPHYVLPAWPALALAVGGTIVAERRGVLTPRDRVWLRRGAWLLAPLLALTLAAMAALVAPAPRGSYLDTAADLAAPALALALVVATAGAVALRDHLAGRYRRGAAVLLGGALAAALVAGGALAPALERLKPAPPLAAAVRGATAAGVPVVTFDFAEPSFIFYLGRWPVRELPDAGAVAAWAAEAAPGVLVLPRPAWQRLRAAPWAAGLTEIAHAGGWNVAKGSRLELVALRRAGTNLR
ncbi:MAG TPA: glycosyltransferase family 39 protein [Thermoanaerobaculia bacterium]|nr:glycosyltransferase family 39 protein [Thermoanaerobaculia bacterium]